MELVEAGSYLRPIDFVHHSTLGLIVIKKKKEQGGTREDDGGAWGAKGS